MKLRASNIALALYGIILIGFAFYWVKNYDKFTHYKGDEFFYFLGIITLSTYLFLLVLRLIGHRISFILFLVIPAGIIISSVLLGFLVFAIAGMGGTPSQTFYVYSITHVVVTILVIVLTRKSLTSSNNKGGF